MISLVRNNQIIETPKQTPKNWIDPDTKITYTGFYNFDLDKIFSLGWKEVVDEPLEYNSLYENLNVSDWYYDEENDIVTRDYSIEEKQWIESLTIVADILNDNREKYEINGFLYNQQIQGMDVIILTDKESSQGKLNSGYIKALNGTRLDTDVWKFKQTNGDFIILQLSNEDLIKIGDFVYRKIQDAYNLTSQIFWQMLGTGTTASLKEQIENNTINLNPWGV